MKATLSTLTLVAVLGLAGCHASRDKAASSSRPAPSSSTAASGTDKAIEKSRDAMMSKDMDLQNEHWASTPAASSTAATPVAAPVTAASAASSSPAVTPSTAKDGKH